MKVLLPGGLTRAGRLAFLCLALLVHPGGGQATSYFAAPWAAEQGDGGFENPWPLATALAHPSIVQPGDVIWLRGGVYRGPFTSELTGSEQAPILVRAYPGERPTLEGCSCPDTVLTVKGAWTWYWGFEVRSADPDRSSDQVRGAGVTVLGPKTRFINLVVHDNNQGFSFWTPAVDAELYGNLVYYNGWEGSDRGHGHGVYAQNETGTKRIVDNVIFDQFSHGIHIYGTEAAPLDNFHVEGNAVFENGALSPSTGYARNLLIGGGRVARNAVVVSNYTYYPTSQNAGENNLGYRAGCLDAAVESNYFVGGTALAVINCEGVRMIGNLLYGAVSVAVQAQYGDNSYVAARPAISRVFVRPNRYEPGRANIVVYNWSRADVVEADLSDAGLAPGDIYELHSAEDYYGKVATGIYTGDPIRIPMSGWAVAAPVGGPAPRSALPDFGVFVLSRVSQDPPCGRWRGIAPCLELPQSNPPRLPLQKGIK